MNAPAPIGFPRRIPFVEELGVELWSLDDGKAELRMDLAERHTNSHHYAHGGVVMTLLDVAMAHAARSRSLSGAGSAHAALADGPGVVTIEMKTSFMRGARGPLRAVGSLLQRTVTMAFCEARLYAESGQLCAHATGTFKYVRPPASRASPPETETP
jgi:uncharacterized protein (TIGR00369 family)